MTATGIALSARFAVGQDVAPVRFGDLPQYSAKSQGRLYVLGFDQGTVKVGRAEDPQERTMQHARAAWAWGARLTRGWVSVSVRDVAHLERQLRVWAERQPGVERRNEEYFHGLDYDVAVAAGRVRTARRVATGPDEDGVLHDHSLRSVSHQARRTADPAVLHPEWVCGLDGETVGRAAMRLGATPRHVYALAEGGYLDLFVSPEGPAITTASWERYLASAGPRSSRSVS